MQLGDVRSEILRICLRASISCQLQNFQRTGWLTRYSYAVVVYGTIVVCLPSVRLSVT